jgi:hypothetical protein
MIIMALFIIISWEFNINKIIKFFIFHFEIIDDLT